MRRKARFAFAAFILAASWLVISAALISGRLDSVLEHIGNPAISGGLSLVEVENPQAESIANQVCLDCHGVLGLAMTLENGETLSLYVSPEDYATSVHGKSGYACVQCHTQVGNYPHPPFTAQNVREASLRLYQACQRCHASQYELTEDSVHVAALERGNFNAAICTDCHTAHNVRRLTDHQTGDLLPEAHTWIPETCAQCHNAIYQKYLTSVHGSALVGEGNPDVPTCIDCHGVHDIEDPTTAAFRLRSPQICASCHTDPERMAKYGLSTDVLRTYVADFHGTTVTLFERQSPDAETNKPVCYDCHGIHDIRRVGDPEKGLSVRENLLLRCQVCHPDATANFPDAWLSHYIPSPEKTPLVFYVNLFYRFFIPAVLGGMAVLVALDLSKLLRSKARSWVARKGKPAAPPATSLETGEAAAVGGDPVSEVSTDERSFPEKDTLPEGSEGIEDQATLEVGETLESPRDKFPPAGVDAGVEEAEVQESDSEDAATGSGRDAALQQDVPETLEYPSEEDSREEPDVSEPRSGNSGEESENG